MYFHMGFIRECMHARVSTHTHTRKRNSYGTGRLIKSLGKVSPFAGYTS